MANQRILASEEMVGHGHATKADTLNRLEMIEHNEDGTHKMSAGVAGDLFYHNGTNLTRLGKGTALQYLRQDAGLTAPEWATLSSGLPMGHLSGLGLSHAADTEHDITVAAGKARDATDAVDMALAAAITKRADAEWAVGDTNGGMAAGESLPASGTIHIWLIKRSDTGVVDVMANNHATTGLTPTLPASYDYKRRIFSLRTDSSSNIINGDQWGTGQRRTFIFDTPILDLNNVTPGDTNAHTIAISTPAGIIVKALLVATSASAGGLLSSLASADVAVGAMPDVSSNNFHATGAFKVEVFTNTANQVRIRQRVNEAASVGTYGWEDSL